jgi:hypothetical protein
MSPVAADWASADSAAGAPADALVVEAEAGAAEVVDAPAGAADVELLADDEDDDEPQPAATAEVARTAAAAESLWIEFIASGSRSDLTIS